MHWGAMVDGNDVEFELGSSPAATRTLSSKEAEAVPYYTSVRLDRHFLTIRCVETQENEAGIDKLVKAFIFTDPHYPRPGQSDGRDKEPWSIFREEYLDASRKLTQGSGPDTFTARVERDSKNKSIDKLF